MLLAPRVLALSLLLSAGPALAEVYRWTDESGRLHFTQSLDQVPPRFRDAARASSAEAGPEIQTYSAPARVERGAAPLGGALRIPFERQGTLMKVRARVNDVLSAPFYVDTGASGVSLPRFVVDQLGIPIGPGTPHAYVSTANGMLRVPVVTIDSVELGGARVENLAATVNPSMQIGLLGGSFFNNFVYAVDAAEGVITLRVNEGIRAGAGEEEWRRRFREVRRPLEEVERYLETREISRPGRRRELEQRRAELRQLLEDLDREASRLGVPVSWRE